MNVELETTFVALDTPTGHVNPAGYHPAQGLYWSRRGERPTTAFIATHYNVDFSEHYLAPLLAERGFGFLGWNTRYRGAEAFFILEHALIDIAAGVRWLREEAAVETVVLLGNSGGGSLMAAYQSQAVEPNIEPVAGMKLPEAVFDLPPGDLYVSLQAHIGRPEVLTAWMDPSVVDETDPLSTDPSIDMYNPENGPPYPDEFVVRYRAAQIDRNHRITAWALKELERLQAVGSWDRQFPLYRVWADLRYRDGSIDPSQRPLDRCYLGSPEWANRSPYNIGGACTLRTWLSMWSLETSYCKGTPHLKRIHLPSIIIQSNADTGVFPSDARAIHDALGSGDKELRLISGDHYLETPAGARESVADLIAEWTAKRHR